MYLWFYFPIYRQFGEEYGSLESIHWECIAAVVKLQHLYLPFCAVPEKTESSICFVSMFGWKSIPNTRSNPEFVSRYCTLFDSTIDELQRYGALLPTWAHWQSAIKYPGQLLCSFDNKVLNAVSLCMQLGSLDLYVVRDLFPAGPISGIFISQAPISCNCDLSFEIDSWFRHWIPPQIIW